MQVFIPVSDVNERVATITSMMMMMIN